MEPEVIAAVVATPAALIAAVAAYAAGRLQAQAAHRGPIDAVRRQHQRDAYAAFLSATNSYRGAVQWKRCMRLARAELAERDGNVYDRHFAPGFADREAHRIRWREAEPLYDALKPAFSVVTLEGPSEVVDRAQEVMNASFRLAISCENGALIPDPLPYPVHYDPDGDLRSLGQAVTAFTAEARSYLNGEPQVPRWRRWLGRSARAAVAPTEPASIGASNDD